MDNPTTSVFGTNCLMARRLVERGVRFIELYSGAGSGWDAHNDWKATILVIADRPTNRSQACWRI
jgi:hypothetical protein